MCRNRKQATLRPADVSTLLVCATTLPAPARTATPDGVAEAYARKMDSLAIERREADRVASLYGRDVPTNPYFFRLVFPGTLYDDALHYAMGVDWAFGGGDSPLRTASLGVDYWRDETRDIATATDHQLAHVYAHSPRLIVNTESDFRQEPGLRHEVEHPIETEARLAERAIPVDLDDELEEFIEVEARRPKFWTLKGNGSVQMTQSYYSNNWYQGGDKNYAGLAMLTFEANYDNKQKLQWDNKLEVELGFQTSTDTIHNIKATNNLLRYTTNLGYQATKNWYYTASVQTYTQILRYYDTNAYTYSTSFASPLHLTISVGMTYKFGTKRDIFSGSLLLSPIAYSMRYVGCDSLRTHYSVEEGKKALHNFGPSLTLEYTLVPCKNVTWESRLYYFTNLSYVNFEWENTFTFTINKYLSTKLFIYPRFDDSSEAYRGDHGYFMFKEWLSLGLSFNF